jgi:hypothetical protein
MILHPLAIFFALIDVGLSGLVTMHICGFPPMRFAVGSFALSPARLCICFYVPAQNIRYIFTLTQKDTSPKSDNVQSV